MDIFDSVQEATTKQLQRKQKSVTRLFPQFPDRVKAVADNGGLRLKEVEPEMWHFKIHSGTKKDVWYDAYLKFKNVAPTIQRIVMDRRLWIGDKSRVDRKKLARKFMDTVDVQILCSCPAFQYWGPAYILSLGKYDAKHTDRELRPPRIRNPKQYGAFCKHLQNLMKVLPFYTDTVMEWIVDFYEDVVHKAEEEARRKYGWVKTAAKKLGKKKKEVEEEPGEEGTRESRIREVHELGSCMIWAENKTKDLLSKGVDDFKIIEGYVYFAGYEPGENRAEHTWIELSDGTILDETVDQFERWGFSKNQISYQEQDRREYTPKEYLELCRKYPV